ncbi:scavenger receptor class B member 1-like [Lutzomyia longipalpis]|uniref:scavenger receptor class B member 1-like n=1 Tax=Lutzomyia longipalpis TaxID=7200 RepID=UPI002483D8D4|nr:scavenger receptor class B member 1-like [Lutzomyia longipalpis]XP_055687526.1 scavenger receptor class B member 1-like [Lutzomyia longipalpis]XP_055687527.1 scavenger receptor class B member 1-like [Lutzomyia longipalpis]XP_055687528.1 scavenger receptor class B member 1-like [Lutzomyia longipalpis]
MEETKEIPLNTEEEERMLQPPAKEQIVPTAIMQFTPVVEKKRTFLDTLLDIFGSSSSKDEGKVSVAKKKKITLLAIVLLLMGFVISATGFFIMWFTELYNDTLISRLVLRENTLAAEWWANPPLHSYLKVYIFNYTNVDRFNDGTDEKLVVEEIGPYVYYEKLTKEDIVFNDNNTISYREKRVNYFLPDMNTWSDLENITVPNIPMLTAMKKVKDRGFFVQLGLNTALSATSSTVFKHLPVNEFLWGYEDGLISVSKTMLPPEERPPFEKFGLLINRNATSLDNFTIHTGEGDIRQLAKILSLNGEDSIDFWTSDECNLMGGTDGSQFPPHLLQKKDRLELYIKDMCRKFPLEYEKDVTVFDGIPAWRYKAPDDVFANPKVNPDNQCYCHQTADECPKSGLFNSSICAYGAPIYLSFPHFYTGDERLYDKISGLHPDPEKHMTYADIHPRLAFPINGASRFQINVEVFQPAFTSSLYPLKEGDILPVLWLEVVPGEFSDELISLIFHSSFSANAVQIGLRYGTLLLTATFLALLIGVCWHRGKNSKQ